MGNSRYYTSGKWAADGERLAQALSKPTSVPVFLIEVDDTKNGVVHPTVIGPFPDENMAEEFAEKYSLGTAAQDGAGGYSAYHVISVNTCDYSPDSYAETHEMEDN